MPWSLENMEMLVAIQQAGEILIEVIEPLVHAHVKTVERGCVLVCGQEEQVGQAPNVTQVSWCKPICS
ncbi:hypothetical protein [Variovorax sp. N23]|uniref:hypothetical protein n=1 Tax=Variovorax sp. N23 TaxID=2980555 RepID=UPI0021CA0957|nr:hypothetical protein [Variovorax sp. N23]MCU4122212.1 hypothetical protein [Variovorax sp. N23]